MSGRDCWLAESSHCGVTILQFMQMSTTTIPFVQAIPHPGDLLLAVVDVLDARLNPHPAIVRGFFMEIPMTRDAIRSIQTGLNTLGHEPGPIDGLIGRNTRGAAERWLTADGKAAPAPAPAVPLPVTSAVIHQGAARYPVDEIIVHCAATRADWMAGRPLAEKVAEIRRWHMSAPLNWKDIGYHWIIDRDGKVLPGRKETVIGAHAGAEKNRGTLGVCLIGGHGSSENDRFLQHYTRQQDITLRQMIEAISTRTAIRRVTGHNNFAAKACLGFQVSQWLKGA